MSRARVPHLVIAVVLALGACSGGDDGDGDVATLDPSSTSTTSADDGAGAGDEEREPTSRDEALVSFMQCLRDNGVADAPDPEPNEDGELRLPLNDSYANDPDYAAAEETCGHFLEDVIGPERTPEQILEAEDHALEHARCMRAQGIDMPDPPPGGQGFNVLEDSQGNPIDPNDPAFEAAIDICNAEVFG